VDAQTPTTPPELPIVDDGYTKRVFDDLSKMDVDLDPDPLIYGPKRLQKKIAACRKHLTRCQQMFLQLSDDLHRFIRTHRQERLAFDLNVQDLFANDPETRSGRNVRDREAIAASKLRPERERIMFLEASIQDLETVLTVVKAKREDLKDILGRIRDQYKLCQEEIGLGSRWGTTPPPGETTPDIDRTPRVNTEALRQFQEDPLFGSDLEKFVASELGDDDTDAVPKIVEVPKPQPPKAPVKAPAVKEPVKVVEPEKAQPPKPEFSTWPLIVGMRCSICKGEVRTVPGGSCCAEGHGGAPLEPIVDPVTVAVTEVAVDTVVQDSPEDDLIATEPAKDLADVLPASSSSAAIDDFFGELDLDALPKKRAAAPIGVSTEIELDDLIGMFGGTEGS